MFFSLFLLSFFLFFLFFSVSCNWQVLYWYSVNIGQIVSLRHEEQLQSTKTKCVVSDETMMLWTRVTLSFLSQVHN